MDLTHLHLLITHLPIFGSFLGAFVLLHGLWSKNDQTCNAAYYVLIISALGAGAAYLTGETAEERVEKLQGVSETILEQHEDFAVYALIALIIIGMASIIGLIVTLKKHSLSRTIAGLTLFISIVGFCLVAYTGYLGGQIRHSEIRSSQVEQTNISTENDDGEDH